MKLSPTHIEYERYCTKLIGLTISSVQYLEVVYSETDPKPFYKTEFEDLDSIDFSITLKTTDNQTVEIYWDDRFYQFGIGIKLNEKSDFTWGQKWEVSNTALWEKFIGMTIVNISLSWESITVTEFESGKKRVYTYPQDVKIAFSNDKQIFISAAGFLKEGDKEVCCVLDNLVVTDNEELARKVKMI